MDSEQSTTIATNQEQQNFNINLENILYNDNFRIKCGAVAQLIKGLQKMESKISIEKETDDYKRILYPKLRELSEELVNRFKCMLNANDEKEKNIKYYNLCGYNGQVRTDKYNKYPFVAGVNPNAKYGFANFGYYIRMIRQRLEFITSRDVPFRYTNDEISLNTFNNLKVDCNNLVKYLNETVEPEWNSVVENARNNSGDNVKQNLQLRQQAREKRLQEKNSQQNFKRKNNKDNTDTNMRRGFKGPPRGNFKRNFRGNFRNGQLKYVQKMENNNDEANKELNGASSLENHTRPKFAPRRGSGTFRGRSRTFRNNNRQELVNNL